MKMDIGIVGGSIAGTALADRLLPAGHRVTVLERSSSDLDDRGLGIAMDPAVARTLGEDFGIPITRRTVLDRNGVVRWQRSLAKRTVRWSAVHHALASRVPHEVVEHGTTVHRVGSEQDRAWVETNQGIRRDFDLVVGADGIGSQVRNVVDPGFDPEYLGYVAIRGLVSIDRLPVEASPILDTLVDGSMLNSYLDRSHVVAYPIESPSGEILVNWMWYRNTTAEQLDDLLETGGGETRRWSLPPGGIPQEHLRTIRREATESMADSMSSILLASDSWSLQAIHGGIASGGSSDRLILIGDAARIAIPHVGAGTSLAITDARTLAEAIDGVGDDFEERLARWAVVRRGETEQTMAFGRDLGRFLQFSGTDWTTWSSEDFDRWWTELLAGRRLYFESSQGES